MSNNIINIENNNKTFLTANTAGFLVRKKKNIAKEETTPNNETPNSINIVDESIINPPEPIQIFNTQLIESSGEGYIEIPNKSQVVDENLVTDNNVVVPTSIVNSDVTIETPEAAVVTTIGVPTVVTTNGIIDNPVIDEGLIANNNVVDPTSIVSSDVTIETPEAAVVPAIEVPTADITNDVIENPIVDENLIANNNVVDPTSIVSSDVTVETPEAAVVTTIEVPTVVTTNDIIDNPVIAEGLVTDNNIVDPTSIVNSDVTIETSEAAVVTTIEVPTLVTTNDVIENQVDDSSSINIENMVEPTTNTDSNIVETNPSNEENDTGENNLSNTNTENTTQENIFAEKHTIDEFEEAENEFAVKITPEPTPQESEQSINSTQDMAVQETARADELNQNPSSIFNIPLIVTAPTPEVSKPVDTKTETIEDNTNTEIEHQNTIDDAKVEESPSPATNVTDTETNNIDFFNFEFKTPQPEKAEIKTELSLDDDAMQFDFNSVIREPENKGTLDTPTEKIDLDKFLEPKENLIKNASEAEENDNNVIRIKEDSKSDSHHNKKYLLYGFYVLLLIVAIFFCIKIYKSYSNFALTRTEITLAINSTYQAEVVSNSKIQDNKKYQWSSSNTKVVTVDENGLITSVGNGEATVFVEKGSNKKELKVTAVAIEIVSITFKDKELTLKVGEEKTLQAVINDDESIVIDLVWESSDPNVITVDQNGHAIAVGEGTAYIQVYDEVSGLLSELPVTVKPSKNGQKPETKPEKPDNETEKVEVTAVALNKSDLIMEVDEYVVVSAVVRPANATDKKVTWSSSNKSVATVSSTGKITAKSEGTATITAKTSNGKKASLKVTVTKKFIHVNSVSLDKEEATLTVGESISLKATVSPNNATNQKVTWSSSDTKVATVSNGKVTAKGAGTATITVTTSDGNKKDVFNVTVKEKEIIKVSGITLSKDSLSLETGEEATITATITPDNATNKSVTWSTSNANVATVSGGKITAKGAGTATITATSSDGSKTATCTVTVTAPIVEATKVSLNASDITLKVGETFQLKATITPSNTSDKTLTWTSSKQSYASVSENGLITALKPGTVNITVKTANGKRATCQVTIKAADVPEEPPEPDNGE